MALVWLTTLLLLTLCSHSPAEERPSETDEAPKLTELSAEDINMWRTSGLVDDLSLADAPHALIDVKFGSTTVMKLGETLAPGQAASAPMVSLDGFLHCGPPYTLIMVDPDAPNKGNPTARSWLHWMVINAEHKSRFQDGEVAMPYNGPTPPKGSGPHRYALLVYCQDGKRLNSADVAPQQRNNFQVTSIAQKVPSSIPAAGTFFYAENA
ncbi:hypothetical protein V5799_031081 [Amblyomma americanum]|uniref:Phosphatidylethanolamine-binding protein n=1 Tax=Amblyomma americanum TaxID=6943 RepID=A0AAQ4ELB1_AMBAM